MGTGIKWSRNWGEREEDTVEFESNLGRSYLTQLVSEKSDVVERESVTVGEPEGGTVMGDMMDRRRRRGRGE